MMNLIDTSPLFTPFRLNKCLLPNRFVMPSMQRGWCENGAPLARLAAYYCRRIRGGVGLIITESLAVDHSSSTQSSVFGRLNRETLGEWSRCAESVKMAGGRILFQLWHEGAVRVVGGAGPLAAFPTLSPSGLVCKARTNGRAATTHELAEIKQAFVYSAELAKLAGADGVEVHAAHGYLLDQFLWSVTNQRTDGYGGDNLEHRLRLPAEIVASIRKACGPDFIISFRFSQWKEADYDAKIVESSSELGQLLSILGRAGVDVFHASTRRFWKPEWPGEELNLAGWSKLLSGLPTITVGSVGLNVDVMETFGGKDSESKVEVGLRELMLRFNRQEFDLISIGRSIIGDPDWVNKVRDGRYDLVRTFMRDDLGSLEGDSTVVAEEYRVGDVDH